MDERELKLKAAKEKLKKFQEAKKNNNARNSPLQQQQPQQHDEAVDPHVDTIQQQQEQPQQDAIQNYFQQVEPQPQQQSMFGQFVLQQQEPQSDPFQNLMQQLEPLQQEQPYDQLLLQQQREQVELLQQQQEQERLIKQQQQDELQQQHLQKIMQHDQLLQQQQQQQQQQQHHHEEPVDVAANNSDPNVHINAGQMELAKVINNVIANNLNSDSQHKVSELEEDLKSKENRILSLLEQVKWLEAEKSVKGKELESCKESIKILVGDKSEAELKAEKLSKTLEEKDKILADLSRKLDNSEDKVRKFEENFDKSKSGDEEKLKFEREIQNLRENLEKSEEKIHEIQELRSKLSVKSAENEELKRNLDETKAKLELTEVNLLQLRNCQTSPSNNNNNSNNEEEMASLRKECKELHDKVDEQQRRESELTAYIAQAGQDREQIIAQYTNYGKQLTAQIESMSHDLNSKQEELTAKDAREAELVANVQRLEVDMNSMRSRSKTPNVDLKEMELLRRKNNELEEKLSFELNEKEKVREELRQMDRLKEVLVEKETLISGLETRMEMLETSSPSGDSMRKQEELMLECQSDKVAASRAMAQNSQLKSQLEELQMGLIQMTNSKAEIAGELESVKRKLNPEHESQSKMELNALQDAVRERDRTINSLKDQMKYYVAFAENSINGHPDEALLEQEVTKTKSELEQAKEEIRSLSSHNSELRSQLEVLSRNTSSSSSSSASNNSLGGVNSSGRSSSLEDERGHTPISTSSSSSQQEVEKGPKGQQQHHSVIPVLTPDVAFVKLEQKYSEAMQKIAELTSQKDDLEHLTVQLQEETETVGEYITIYQYQRQQIKKRLEEKDVQLQSLAREREELKSKLSQVQHLFANFVQKPNVSQPKKAINDETNGHLDNVDSIQREQQHVDEIPPVEMGKDAAEEQQLLNGNLSSSSSSPSPSTPNVQQLQQQQQQQQQPPMSMTDAEKILSLLSEIGSNQMLHDNFHPWFWDSSQGKLMTV